MKKEYLDEKGLAAFASLVKDSIPKTFVGTLEEWEKLTDSEKDKYDRAEIIDVDDTTVDEDGNVTGGVTKASLEKALDKVEQKSAVEDTDSAVSVDSKGSMHKTLFSKIWDWIKSKVTSSKFVQKNNSKEAWLSLVDSNNSGDVCVAEACLENGHKVMLLVGEGHKNAGVFAYDIINNKVNGYWLIRTDGSGKAYVDAPDGLAASLIDAPLKDYNGSKYKLKIGYEGDGLNTSNIMHLAGYTYLGNSVIGIKDFSKEQLIEWIYGKNVKNVIAETESVDSISSGNSGVYYSFIYLDTVTELSDFSQNSVIMHAAWFLKANKNMYQPIRATYGVKNGRKALCIYLYGAVSNGEGILYLKYYNA